MSVEDLKAVAASNRRPVRVKRSTGKHPHAVDVGPGTKWNNPIKKRDVDVLVRSEPDIAAAVQKGDGRQAPSFSTATTCWKRGSIQPNCRAKIYLALANSRNRATPTCFLSCERVTRMKA